ncbi:TPA: hypothetical protein ACHK1W_004841, partial [Escherichia coli]
MWRGYIRCSTKIICHGHINIYRGITCYRGTGRPCSDAGYRSGTCSGACSGTCSGTCSGACSGACSGTCSGACSG